MGSGGKAERGKKIRTSENLGEGRAWERGSVPWQEIKAEYITTATSYRKLAAKYGLNYSALGQRAKAEGWVDEKARYQDKTYTQTVDTIGENQVARAVRLQNVTDKVLKKIEALVESVDIEYLPAKSIRALTAALKDIKEIQGVKSSLDEQEQRARIDNLRRQFQKDTDTDGGIEVCFDSGETEDWSG